jgi:hypothetical protein
MTGIIRSLRYACRAWFLFLPLCDLGLLTFTCLARAELVCSADRRELDPTSGGFAADRAESDDRVVWDDAEEDEDVGSRAAVGSSSATNGDKGSEELVDSGEPLSHCSKFPGPSSLRDWSEDDDDKTGSVATPGVAALHVATAAAAGAQASPVVDFPESLERHPVVPEPASPEPADLEEAGGRPAGAKRRAQPAPSEPAEKHRKPEPATKDLHHLKTKKMTKRRATAVAG